MSLSQRLFGSTTFQGGLVPLRVPIICAPLATASGGALAAAVTRAGGLGFCGAGYWTAERAREELEVAAEEVGAGRTCLGPSERRPVGVGLLAWKLTEQARGTLPRPSDKPGTSPAHALVHLLAAERVAAAWFSFGTAQDVQAWVAYVRYWDDQLRGDAPPIRIVLGVGSVEQARSFLPLRPDALSLMGHEGGGHGLAASPPVRDLLVHVRAAIPRGAGAPLLLAAGGLADGREARELLDMGADAAVFGTRFLLTPESLYSDGQKDMLLRAGSRAPGLQGNRAEPTVRSTAFDQARGTTGWPEGVDGRALHSQTVVEYQKGDPTFRTAYSPVQLERVVTWAGTGIVRINDILPAEALTRRLAHEVQIDPNI